MRPRSGDEGRKEEAAAAAAADAAAAARTEIRSRVFCNYPTLLKMIITLLRVWNVFGPQSFNHCCILVKTLPGRQLRVACDVRFLPQPPLSPPPDLSTGDFLSRSLVK